MLYLSLKSQKPVFFVQSISGSHICVRVESVHCTVYHVQITMYKIQPLPSEMDENHSSSL